VHCRFWPYSSQWARMGQLSQRRETWSSPRMATLTPLGPSVSITARVSTTRTTLLTIDEPAAAGEALPEAVSLQVRMPGLEDKHNCRIGGLVHRRGDCFGGGLAPFHPVGEYGIGELAWSARMSLAGPTGISSPSTSTTLNDPAWYSQLNTEYPRSNPPNAWPGAKPRNPASTSAPLL